MATKTKRRSLADLKRGQLTIAAWRAEIEQAITRALDELRLTDDDPERKIALFQFDANGSCPITREIEVAVGWPVYAGRGGSTRCNRGFWAAFTAGRARRALALRRPSPAERAVWLQRIREDVGFLDEPDPAQREAKRIIASQPRPRPEREDHRTKAAERWEASGHTGDSVKMVARFVHRTVCGPIHRGGCRRLRTIEDHIRDLGPRKRDA
jgi:hypothetical protein